MAERLQCCLRYGINSVSTISRSALSCSMLPGLCCAEQNSSSFHLWRSIRGSSGCAESESLPVTKILPPLVVIGLAVQGKINAECGLVVPAACVTVFLPFRVLGGVQFFKTQFATDNGMVSPSCSLSLSLHKIVTVGSAVGSGILTDAGISLAFFRRLLNAASLSPNRTSATAAVCPSRLSASCPASGRSDQARPAAHRPEPCCPGHTGYSHSRNHRSG